MYNFSGIIYRIWGVGGILVAIGIVLILFEKPWKNGFKLKKNKWGLIAVACGILLIAVYASRIIFPDVSSYTGEFVDTHRNSRAAPPLPVTYEYVFWNGTGKRQVFFLDIYSKKEIFPSNFEYGQTYTVYYDEFTNVIVRVEVQQEQ